MPKSTDRAIVPTASTSAGAGEPAPDWQSELLDAIEAAGLNATEVNVPDVNFALAVSLETYASIEWPLHKCVGVTPPLVAVRLQEFPEADKFDGYKGMIRVEAWNPDGELIAFTTHLVNRSTGELGPIAEYMRGVKLPAAIRIGQFETSTPGRKVFRPVPLREP